MPSVSVIIPTIDRVDRLNRALQSVVSQSRTPEEVVVVSKSDKKELTDIIQSFDISITLIEQSGNGLSNARNEGINASSGSLISFLDDDDWWKQKKIEQQIQAIRNTDAAFIFTGIQHVDSDGNTINFRIPTSKPDKQEILTWNAVGAPSTVLVKRSCLNAVGGFDETLPSREEWDLYIRLLEKFDCEFIPYPLMVKESHDNTISRNIDLIERDWMTLFEKHKSKYDEHTKRQFLSNYHFDLGRMSCKNGNLINGRNHFKKSVVYSNSPAHIPHYIATFFGNRSYAFFTDIYRTLRKTKLHLQHYGKLDPS
ncbi:glycosyltransferase family 2 protein [Halosimplex sp. J119]